MIIKKQQEDEYAGTSILEFAAPKPKSCTIIDKNNHEKSVHEGHTYLNFKSSEFKDVVNDKNVFRHIMKKNHLKNMKFILKKAIKHISCFDNKRQILEDGINTLPYGQKDIPVRN